MSSWENREKRAMTTFLHKEGGPGTAASTYDHKHQNTDS